MNGLPRMIVDIAQVMDLSMAVMARCNAVIRLCCQDLVCFEFPVVTPRIRIPGLEKSAAAAAAIVVRPVGVHFDEIFFTHHRLHGISQILGHRVPKGFANQLTGILNRKFDFQVFVPVGVDLQLPFFDPLGIILDDASDLKLVLDIEFFQSGPDCKKFVPSLGIEPDLAF